MCRFINGAEVLRTLNLKEERYGWRIAVIVTALLLQLLCACSLIGEVEDQRNEARFFKAGLILYAECKYSSHRDQRDRKVVPFHVEEEAGCKKLTFSCFFSLSICPIVLVRRESRYASSGVPPRAQIRPDPQTHPFSASLHPCTCMRRVSAYKVVDKFMLDGRKHCFDT